MSLPPGFLDELRTRVTLSSVVGRKVTWDMRKSNLAKGDFWAPCPFHQEKSASFHVDDRKGFYYCFGCHAKGDALTFLREAEGLGLDGRRLAVGGDSAGGTLAAVAAVHARDIGLPLALQVLFIAVPAVLMVAAAWVLRGYPLTPARHDAIRAALDARDGAPA